MFECASNMLKSLTFCIFPVLHVTSSTLETRYMLKSCSVLTLSVLWLIKPSPFTMFAVQLTLCPDFWLMFTGWWNSEVEKKTWLIIMESWPEIYIHSNAIRLLQIWLFKVTNDVCFVFLELFSDHFLLLINRVNSVCFWVSGNAIIKCQYHFSPCLLLVHRHKIICWAVWKIMLSVCLHLVLQYHGNDLIQHWLAFFCVTVTDSVYWFMFIVGQSRRYLWKPFTLLAEFICPSACCNLKFIANKISMPRALCSLLD